MTEPVRVPDAKVALSTGSVYPESTATAFEVSPVRKTLKLTAVHPSVTEKVA